jgi:hypothetical protein
MNTDNNDVDIDEVQKESEKKKICRKKKVSMSRGKNY